MEWSKFLSSRWGVSAYVVGVTLLILLIMRLVKLNKRTNVYTSGRILFVGVFSAAFAFFMPLYLAEGMNRFVAAMSSFQHSFRIFGLDGDFLEFVVKREYPKGIKTLYVGYGSVLFAIAPVLTFGFILAFFKNFFAHMKYSFFLFGKTHVFSELNEKSLALADSILKNNKPLLGLFPRVLIVFTDIIDKKEELHLDLVEEAKGMGAILFRKDLESVKFKSIRLRRKVNFYLISEDESEKNRHAESIVNRYDDKNVALWIFSDDIRTELMLANNEAKNMKITRVNDIQALIYHNLDENGVHLFERARSIAGEGNVISAVIVGLGKYGQEMLKALAWYCQLEGYKLKINAFDADKKAREKFTAKCPELMSDKYNGNKECVGGEAYYEINIHNGVDVSVPEFEQKLKEINDATYIFVCLGNDEINLGVAAKIRSMCERIEYEVDGRKPAVETVIYDSNIREKLGISWKDVEITDRKNKDAPGRNKKRYEYDVLMIGDLENFYSEETVINSELEAAGFDVHKFWSVEPARISFAQERMEIEWNEFIRAEKLEASWTEHCREQKEKNKGSLELSDAINGFSFMTDEEKREEDNAKNTENKKKLIELKNTVAYRKDRWEKQVYAKFRQLMNTSQFEEEWKQIESARTIDAEKSFGIEYNYRSSIAKAIHKRLRKKLGFKSQITDKAWEDMTLEEKIEIGKIEHVRWNAYMRTEGYSYSGNRNDLARVHHKLVPVSELSNDDLRKDA